MKNKKQIKKESGFRRFLKSPKTTIVFMLVLMTPFLILGFILVRDKLGAGTPVVGSRNDQQLAHTITDDMLKEIETTITSDTVVDPKVRLTASTLRIYVTVNEDTSKDAIKALGESVYEQVITIVPIDPYFTNTETNKQYDLEIHVFNNVEDKTAENFIYFEVMHGATMEATSYTFLTDAKDPEFKEEVLELMEQKAIEKAEKEAQAKEDAEKDAEEDTGGE